MAAPAAHTGKEAGLPHLDPEWFSSQIFWLVVTFAVLYYFMAAVIVPRIREVVEARASRISHDIDRAEQYQSEAEAARSRFEADMAASRSKAQQMLQEAQDAVAKRVVSAHTKQDAKLQEDFARAERDIAAAMESARGNLVPAVTDVVQTIVKSLTNKDADSKRAEKLVSAALQGEKA